MDSITQRQWETLTYSDPRHALEWMRRRHGPPHRGDPLRRYRSGRHRYIRERHQAAILCHGLATAVLKRPVFYALAEDADYDCVMAWRARRRTVFIPVQLKEVVPTRVNPDSSIDGVLEKLTRYASSDGLVVGIHLNREGIRNLAALDLPSLNLRELWIFGQTGRAPNEWAIYGNVLGRPKLHLFEYP